MQFAVVSKTKHGYGTGSVDVHCVQYTSNIHTLFLASGGRWALKEGDICRAEVQSVYRAARVAPTQDRFIRVARV